MSKEKKEYKESNLNPKLKISNVKKDRLKSLVKQHLFITPKYIENNNNFFFWKSLLQDYSHKKSVCIFIQNPDLTSKELHEKLLNCIHSILKSEIDRLKLYSEKVIELIEKDELLPIYIKKMVIQNSKTQFDDIAGILEKYKGNKKIISNFDRFEAFYQTIKIILKDEFKMNSYDKEEEFWKDVKKFESDYYDLSKGLQESINDKDYLMLTGDFVNFIRVKNLPKIDVNQYDPYPKIFIDKLDSLKGTFNCDFFEDTYIDVKIKRDVIECIERTLAMNIQKLPLSNRIKITQEIETVVPKIEIETVIKLREVNPLYFEIYQKSLRVSDKNSLLPKSVSNIINYLNGKYVKLIQENKLIKQRTFVNKKGIVETSYDCKVENKRGNKADVCKILEGLKLISTFKFLMFFVNETDNLIKYNFFDDRKLIDSDIDMIKSLSFNLDYYSGGWSDNRKFETVKEYIYYLINNLNLFVDVLNIKLSKEENVDIGNIRKKDIDEYFKEYNIDKKWYDNNKEFVNFVNFQTTYYMSSSLYNDNKGIDDVIPYIRQRVFSKFSDINSDNLTNLIKMFFILNEEGKNEQYIYKQKEQKLLKKEDYDYKKYGISKELFDFYYRGIKNNYTEFKTASESSGRVNFIMRYVEDYEVEFENHIANELDLGKFYDMFENTTSITKKKEENKEIINLADRLYIYIKNNPKFSSITLESFSDTLEHVVREIQTTEINEEKNIKINTEDLSYIDYRQYIQKLSKDDLSLLLAKDEDLLEAISNNNFRSYADIPKEFLLVLLMEKYKKSENKEYKELKEGKEHKGEHKREGKESKELERGRKLVKSGDDKELTKYIKKLIMDENKFGISKDKILDEVLKIFKLDRNDIDRYDYINSLNLEFNNMLNGITDDLIQYLLEIKQMKKEERTKGENKINIQIFDTFNTIIEVDRYLDNLPRYSLIDLVKKLKLDYNTDLSNNILIQLILEWWQERKEKRIREKEKEIEREIKELNEYESEFQDPLLFSNLNELNDYLKSLTKDQLYNFINTLPTDYFDDIDERSEHKKNDIINRIVEWWTTETAILNLENKRERKQLSTKVETKREKKNETKRETKEKNLATIRQIIYQLSENFVDYEAMGNYLDTLNGSRLMEIVEYLNLESDLEKSPENSSDEELKDVIIHWWNSQNNQ